MLEMMNLSVPKGGDVPSSEILPEYIQAQQSVVMYLHKPTGDLYGYGNAPEYRLGNGVTSSVPNFVKIYSNCKYFWLGQNGTLLATNDNKFYYVGNRNAFPPLGTGGGNVLSFTEVTVHFTNIGVTPDDIKTVGLGSGSCRVLTKDGKVFCCGSNTNGECGNGTRSMIANFVQITSMGEISQLATRPFGTHFLTTDGREFFAGYDAYGESGRGALNNHLPTPTLITTDVRNIVVATVCTWRIKNNGDVYWSGLNTQGSAGTGSFNNAGTVLTPIKNDALSGALPLEDGLIYPSGIQTGDATGAPIICFGRNTIKNGGENGSGQVGDGVSYTSVYNYVNMVKPVTFGDKKVLGVAKDYVRSFVVTDDYQLFAAGGRTGTGWALPDGGSSITPMRLMTNMPWY